MPQYNMAKLAQGFWRRHQKTAGATESLINFGQKLAPYQNQLALASLLGTAASSGAYGYGQTGTPLGAALGAVGGVGGGHIGGHLGSALANRLGFDYTKDVKHVVPHVLLNLAGDIGGTMAGSQLSRLAKPKPFFTPRRRNAALLAALAGAGTLGYALSKTSSARRVKQAARDGLLDEVVLGMNRDDPSSLLSVLPFGSSYIGYRRGADDDRRLEGVVRGVGGGLAGGLAGGLTGALPGVLLKNPHLAYGGAGLGAVTGDILGAHLATRGLVDKEASLRPKTANDAAHGAASLAAMVPFGSSLVGYLRGKAVGRPEAGVVRGILGSSVGHALGRLASGVPAALLTGDPVIASTVGAIGSMGGRVLGHHLATKGLVEEARRRRLVRAALAGTAGAGALGYALRSRDED